MNRIGSLCCITLLLGIANSGWGQKAKGKAVSSQPVHPVLIRNEHSPLTRVVVEVTEGEKVVAKSFVFQLDGTDDLGDLESLSLFSTGNKEEFSSATPIGEPAKPAKEVTFRGERVLAAGKNIFWLSCRLKPTADLAHRVAATCRSIETTTGKLTPRDDSPGARHRIGVALRKHKDDGVHTYRIPALATSAKGTLLCVYDMRRRMGRDLQEDIDIGLSRSADGGRSWEPVRVIMDMGEYGGLPQELNGCSDPGLIVDRQTGEIFCFAVWMNGKPGKHQWNDDGSEPGFEIGRSAQFLMVRSQDDGLTWSKPENLTRKLKQESWWLLAPSPQQGINLPDGTLVMPVQGRDGRAATATFSTLMISRDRQQFSVWPESFLRPGLRSRDSWFYGDMYQNWGVVETKSAIGDAPPELSLYVTERTLQETGGVLRRYSLRIDGFVSLHAPLVGGELITRPLMFVGNQLTLNFSTSAAGSVRVEIQDVDGLPLPGFELAGCQEVYGDDLNRTVIWAGNPDLGAFAGKPVQLRFEVKDADLYSFQFRAGSR